MLQMFFCGWLLMLSAQEKNSLMRLGRWKYRQRMVGDFLFCLFWAVLLWIVLMAVSGGLVRNYIVIGFFSGAVIYHFFCRRILEPVCCLAAKSLLFCWRWFWKMILTPWRMLCRLILIPWFRWQKKQISRFFEKIVPKKQEIDPSEENIIEYQENFLK